MVDKIQIGSILSKDEVGSSLNKGNTVHGFDRVAYPHLRSIRDVVQLIAISLCNLVFGPLLGR